jgi:hypothetical protein
MKKQFVLERSNHGAIAITQSVPYSEYQFKTPNGDGFELEDFLQSINIGDRITISYGTNSGRVRKLIEESKTNGCVESHGSGQNE